MKKVSLLSGILVFLSITVLYGQRANIPMHQESYETHSGYFSSHPSQNKDILVSIQIIGKAGVPWLNISFMNYNLGESSYIIITSLQDGLWQRHNQSTLDQWEGQSAFFNGDQVEIKLYAAPGDHNVFYRIEEILVGDWAEQIESQCGPSDDRIPSNDVRQGRFMSIGCTAWLIPNGKLITAGHCISGTIVQFNVPQSLPNGTIQHPGPEHQYSVISASKISQAAGVGNDWGVFSVNPNTITGLMPAAAQGSYYTLLQSYSGDSIRITGYGVDNNTPVYNQAQQTHIGPNSGSSGTTMRYQTDTEGGNSGSPVILGGTNIALGVHTHGGCSTTGTGNNNGTSFFHTNFWNAVDQGVATHFQLTVNISDQWNMVSIPGLHSANQEVTTWWSGKDPAAGVFKFEGAYYSVATAVAGEGYWMKHVGSNIYNTGDEWPSLGIQIVPHNPINGYTGWNLIGGYDQLVPAGALTTTPPGLITGPVYKYNSGYQSAANLEPGYGYWVQMTGAGFINIPSVTTGPSKLILPSIDGFDKITITDNLSQTYTLYAVKSETDLSAGGDLTQFDLPPYPPQGMFDVRYSSQRYAENLSSTPQVIEMMGVQYPVKIKAEGVGIIISDESGKEITRLKAGEEALLNTSAQKLIVSENVIPTVYALEQNYPNPFNPSTTIQFSIPEDVQNVKLIVYSALGEKVAELVNTGLQAGIYKYQWNAVSVASGMYIYQVVTEKFLSTKKMMFLK